MEGILESLAEILVPMSFIAFLTAIIIVPVVLRSRERARLHETLRIAYEKGQPVAPEMIELLQRDVRLGSGQTVNFGPDRDLRRAVILIGVALGLVAMSFAIGMLAGYAPRYGILASAAIPGFVGLGYLTLWYFGRNKPQV
jgi:hypothetical protein